MKPRDSGRSMREKKDCRFIPANWQGTTPREQYCVLQGSTRAIHERATAMARRINIAWAAKVAGGTGWSEKKIRAILAEDLCPLSIELGDFKGGRRDANGQMVKGRSRLLDI